MSAAPTGNRRWTARMVTALVCAGVGSGAWAGEADPVWSESRAAANYAIGYELGRHLSGLAQQGIDPEPQAIFQGALDALSNIEPRVNLDAMRQALGRLQADPAAPGEAQDHSPTAPALPSRTLGFVDDFAALNAKRPGVVTLPSGVQYEVLNAGQGFRPQMGDRVAIRYEGRLATGVVFDTTQDDPEPARLRVDEIVVPGLREALLLMQEGDRWRIVVPPAMGFSTSGNNLLRKRDLIYEVELVGVEAPEPGSAAEDTTSGTPASAAEGGGPDRSDPR